MTIATLHDITPRILPSLFSTRLDNYRYEASTRGLPYNLFTGLHVLLRRFPNQSNLAPYTIVFSRTMKFSYLVYVTRSFCLFAFLRSKSVSLP